MYEKENLEKNIYSATLKREQSIQVHCLLYLLKAHIQLWFPDLQPASLVARGSLSLFLPSSQVAAPPGSTQRHCWNPDVAATTRERLLRKENTPLALSSYPCHGNSQFLTRMLSSPASLLASMTGKRGSAAELWARNGTGAIRGKDKEKPALLLGCSGQEALPTEKAGSIIALAALPTRPCSNSRDGTASHQHGHCQDPGVSPHCWG